MREFKIGDRVKVTKECTGTEINKIYILGIPNSRSILCCTDENGDYCACENKWILVKGGKIKPDNMIRYMVYGSDCENESPLYMTEKEL